jgi:hypothetical protein
MVQNLVKQKINAVAEEYNIKHQDMEYVSSMHLEKGHLHVHLVFWDKTCREKTKPFVSYEKINKAFNKSIYKEELNILYEQTNIAKKEISEKAEQYLDTYTNELIKLTNPYLSKRMVYHQHISDEKQIEIAEKTAGLQKAIKEQFRITGKASYKQKYLSAELKYKLREISNLIYKNCSETRNRVDSYVDGKVEEQIIYTGEYENETTKKEKQEVRNKATEFSMVKIDNQVLKFIKDTNKQAYSISKEVNAKYREQQHDREVQQAIKSRNFNVV